MHRFQVTVLTATEGSVSEMEGSFMPLAPLTYSLNALFWAGLSIWRISHLRKRSCSRWRCIIEGIPLSLIALTAIVVAAICVFGLIPSQGASFRGAIYVVDGHRMRIDCEGKGSPTLVLNSGLGNDGLIWSRVQTALATTTRVCSYDRAGYGWSDPVSTVRDADHIAAELHGLLLNAGVRGPLVLMAHSIAGLYVRDYVNHYPDGVVGLVLVDASAPSQYRSRITETDSPSLESRIEQAVFLLRLNRLVGACPGSFPGPRLGSDLPFEGVCREHLDTYAEELRNFDSSSIEAVSDRSYGTLPILILSRGTTDKSWNNKQEEMTRLSADAHRIIATGSSHYVQLDSPELVVNQVRLFIERLSR
jgi:pimeloyl-ACP methyl ester carboxylesterase